jgi:Na+/proline symporter
VIGLFGGGLCGVFLLGVLTRRSNGIGAVTGLIVSGLVQYTVVSHTQISVLLYSFTGMLSCVIVGYLVSIVTPRRGKSIDGLTIYTLKKGV